MHIRNLLLPLGTWIMRPSKLLEMSLEDLNHLLYFISPTHKHITEPAAHTFIVWIHQLFLVLFFCPDHKISAPVDAGPWTYFIHKCSKGLCLIWCTSSSFSCRRLSKELNRPFGQMLLIGSQRVENEIKGFSLFRSFLQGNLMPYYKWGWHLAQSANLFYSVIFTNGFWDCDIFLGGERYCQHFFFFSDTQLCRGNKAKMDFGVLSFHKAIFISFNERKSGFYMFCILLAGKSKSLFYRQTANCRVPAWPDFNFWMCSHILTSLNVRKKHAERAWNQHNKCVLLKILCGGLIMWHCTTSWCGFEPSSWFQLLLFCDLLCRGLASMARALVIIGLSSRWCRVWGHYQMDSSNRH